LRTAHDVHAIGIINAAPGCPACNEEPTMKRQHLISFAIAAAVAGCDQPTSPTTMTASASRDLIASVAGSFESFLVPTPNSQPRQITLGSDGNMWFTESAFNVSQIGVVDPAGQFREFAIPSPFTQPTDITSGLDRALWFTESSGFPNGIGRVTTRGRVREFGPPCNRNGCSSIVPNGISRGPGSAGDSDGDEVGDGNGDIWFTEFTRNAIVKLSGGHLTFHTIPTPGANPHGITLGPDGALWFTEFNGNQIGRITTDGTITEFGPVTGSPDRITLGPDGNLWFTEPFPFDSRIGRITPAGVITEFQLANRAQPRDIVAASDGNLWFTDYGNGQLDRITPAGVVTIVQPVAGGPWGIGRGIGNTIWLTQIDGNRVGRYTIAP
jgi:virginiamycin B lyase